jgi:basic membrane lipoprotein Med (substrate-binding protein (PBP1-ABC) superfamily)
MRMQRHVDRAFGWVVGLAVVALVVASCGTGTSSGSAAASTAGPGSAVASAPSSAGSAVASAPTSSGPPAAIFKVALVAPSAVNDLAFTQSMVEALNSLKAKYNLEIAVSDNQFVLATAGNVIRDYASQGYNMVIAHGSQYGSTIQQLAAQFPAVSFAWGTSGSTFDLPNVFAYQANSQEGGYVQGAMAAMLSKSGVLGVIGPIEVGDAKLYVDGFCAGAKAEKAAISCTPVYTGSFSDASLMATTAKAFVARKADVLTGTAQAVVGAIGVAKDENLPWFGTQWTQESLAPANVVSSQMYDWATVLEQIFTAISGGKLGGEKYTLTLGNGGERIQFNPGFNLPADVKAKAESLIKGIGDGTITVPQ